MAGEYAGETGVYAGDGASDRERAEATRDWGDGGLHCGERARAEAARDGSSPSSTKAPSSVIFVLMTGDASRLVRCRWDVFS